MLLRIQAEHYGEDCYECGCGTYSGMTHEEVFIADLLKEMADYELEQHGLIRIKPDDKKISVQAELSLKKHGWVYTASIKDRAERKALEQKFWIMNEKGNAYSYYDPKFAEIDLDNLSDETLKHLAEGAQIVQKVTEKSVMSEKDYSRYKTIEKKKQEAAKKKAESSKAKIEKKKQKEIEKAKKLLEEAGELK